MESGVKLQPMADVLEALSMMSDAPRSSPALDSFARLAAKALDTPLAHLEATDFNGQKLVSDVYRSRDTAWLEHGIAGLGAALCRSVCLRGAPLIIGNVPRDPLVHDLHVMPDPWIAAFLGVPVFDAQETLIGVLCVVSDTVRAWSAGDIAILSEIAACVSAEIGLQATLRAKSVALTVAESQAATSARDAALVESMVLKSMEATLPLEARLADLLNACTAELGLDGSTLARINCEVIEIIAASDGPPEPDRLAVDDITGLPAALAMRGSGIVAHPDIDLVSGLVPRMLNGAPCRQHIGVPLIVRGEVYGIMEFGAAAAGREVSESRLSLLTLVAALVTGQLSALSEIRSLQRSEAALLAYVLDRREPSRAIACPTGA